MDENTPDALVNRAEPVPVIRQESITGNQEVTPDPKHKRDKVKDTLNNTGSKIKEKYQERSVSAKENAQSLSDRLFTKLLQQIVPGEEVDQLEETKDVRSSKYINRPSFSLPLMTSNFRRFNARVGVVFVFQNRVERLLTWRTPSHTLSLLAVCTFVCLDPYLFSVLPIAGILFFIMVPAYLARHPPPSQNLAHSSYSLKGPPLAPARTVKPAAEMSKDFFRNMRDLQNAMDDFSTIHDLFIKFAAPLTNFSDEALSSSVFLSLFLATCILFIASRHLPWRLLALIFCWTAIPLGHPSIQKLIFAHHDSQFRPLERTARSFLEVLIANDVILDAPRESREVEIFELQRRKGGQQGEWEGWLFSPTPYDPLSPQRISGDRPKGTRFFEDVQPPNGWEWADKKWVLDLGSWQSCPSTF